jgi:hypothetical protein
MFVGAEHTSDGLTRTAVEPTEGSKVTIMSPNWCDKTTWYYDSTRTVEQLSFHM